MRVCDNSLIHNYNLNNMFCRNLTLSTPHAYQAHSVAGEGVGSALPVESQSIISAEKNCWKSGQNGTETVVTRFTAIGWRTLQHVRRAIVSHCEEEASGKRTLHAFTETLSHRGTENQGNTYMHDWKAEPGSIPLRNWNLLSIPIPELEFELPSLELELNWNCHHWNMN